MDVALRALLTVSPESLVVPVLVTPKARVTRIAGIHDGCIRVHLQASPVDNAANKALVRFFAESLGVPRSSVEITSGHRSRRKRLRITTSESDALAEALVQGVISSTA